MVCGRRRLRRVVRRAWAWRGVACPVCIKVLARGTRGRACLIFRDTPPHTHTPKTKSSLQRRRHTPRVCAGAGRARPASRPGQRPTFLVRGFTDSLSLPHVTVRKGLCSGDGVTCVSRFRLIRSCWTRGKTLQSWVGGSSRGLPSPAGPRRGVDFSVSSALHW